MAGAGGSSFTSPSGAGGGGGGGRQGPADLNVALAMAAGLEWPVQVGGIGGIGGTFLGIKTRVSTSVCIFPFIRFKLL